MESFNIAEAKSHLSELLERVSNGEEILLTRRGKPIARLVPATHPDGSVLGAGRSDPNINLNVLAANQWWKTTSDESWYE